MNRKLIAVAILAILITPIAHTQEKRVLLAEHETLVRLESIEYRLCRGRTALCPDRCGDSGEFAAFSIVKYARFVKHGEFGKKQESFQVQVSDFDRKPLDDSPFAKIARGLKLGDHVRLSWNHDYVTKEGANYPERPLQRLELIEGEALDEALRAEEAAAIDTSIIIEFDLSQLDPDGLRGALDGKVAMAYEFKIPDDRAEEVLAIDSSLQFSLDSRGRVGAGEGATLCIGSTHQENHISILQKLAELPYVERIIECHFE